MWRHISSDISYIKKWSEVKFFRMKFPIEWAIGELSIYDVVYTKQSLTKYYQRQSLVSSLIIKLLSLWIIPENFLRSCFLGEKEIFPGISAK